MIGYIIISVFVLILILFVYTEYKNQKQYEEERRKKRPRSKKEEKKPVRAPRKVPSAKELEEKRVEEQKLQEQRLEEKKSEPEVTKKIDLPKYNYPKFDHSRLMDMGLSPDEAKEFVAELIPQLEAQIPLIKEAIESSDFHKLEQLTHSIKGSSTTVGTGGISDLLAEFNTYIKTGTEAAIVESYFEHLKHYTQELKEQYS